jgi:cysteine desulfurase
MRTDDIIYLDHQATTPVDPKVFAAMMPYFEQSFGNPHSVDHYLGWQAARAVEDAAISVAGLIGADADEIVFTSGATEANNLALLGIGRRAMRGSRQRVLVGAIEHKCVLAAGRVLQEQLGYRVEQVPVDSAGRVDVRALEQAVDNDVLLVAIMAVNNEIGTIQDIRSIGEITRRVGALFHCDGAQAPAALELSSVAGDVDLLSLSAHKMYGPKGIGALYVRRDLQRQIEPLIYGGGQQNGLRSGTVPVALCVGMGMAASLYRSGDAELERQELLRRRRNFVGGLVRLPFPIAINGPREEECHPGNVNACFLGFSAHDILNALQPRLAASTGAACTSGIAEPSHVLRAIGLSIENANASVRFSLGRGTTDSDLENAVVLIGEVLAKLEQAGLGHPATSSRRHVEAHPFGKA